MTLTAKGADRVSFGALYIIVALITLWIGFRLLDYSLEIRFFKDYLLQWETRLTAFSVQQGTWPVFSGNNHGPYMDSLSLKMSQAGIQLPRSNTRVAYRYSVDHFGRKSEEIFVLGLHDRLVLFGLSGKTMRRLDRSVDGHTDLTKGRVRGYHGTAGKTFIGQVRL